MKKSSLIFLLAMLFLLFALRHVATPQSPTTGSQDSEIVVE